MDSIMKANGVENFTNFMYLMKIIKKKLIKDKKLIRLEHILERIEIKFINKN